MSDSTTKTPETTTTTTTSSTVKNMDTFTFNMWVRVFRALALVCVVGLTQYALVEYNASKLKAASCIVLLCLMSSIMILPLGMLVDTDDTRLDKLIVYFEILDLGLLIATAILIASQISWSHAVQQVNAISSYTRFSIKAAAAIAFLAFALTAILLMIGIHDVGYSSSSSSSSETCEDSEKTTAAQIYDFNTDLAVPSPAASSLIKTKTNPNYVPSAATTAYGISGSYDTNQYSGYSKYNNGHIDAPSS